MSHTEMPGLGHNECRFDGLEITHLADQHNVWVLSQDVTKGGLEVDRVGAHLSLVDQT
jgi:hypothetical protein